MKKYIFSIILIFFVTNLYSQRTLRELLLEANLDTLFIEQKPNKIQVQSENIIKEKKNSIIRFDETDPLYPEISNDYLVDKKKAVGEINYSSKTTPTGGLLINVPISLYQDPRGFTPNVSLVYNSQGGNGPLGNGWNINGVSSISRINKSIYYDGKTEAAISEDKNDAFVLDGLRLIRINETATQINFETETGNIKVIGHLVLNMQHVQLTYFEVFYPDGKKAFFGFPASLWGEQLSYPVTQVIDIAGNTIDYKYEHISNHYRVTAINYGAMKQASILFHYTSSRPDDIHLFSGGIKISYEYLLESITTEVNNSNLNTYKLSYDINQATSILKKIDYLASDQSSYNPLIFNYGDGEQKDEFDQNTQIIKGEHYNFSRIRGYPVRLTKGHFDPSDLNEDIVEFPNRYPYYIDGNKIKNQYSPDANFLVIPNKDRAMTTFSDKLGDGFVDLFSLDVNNKFGDELVRVNNVREGDSARIDFKVYKYVLEAGGLIPDYTRSYKIDKPIYKKQKGSLNPKLFFTGNFSGSGKTEVLAISYHDVFGTRAQTECYLFDLEKETPLFNDKAPFNYTAYLYEKGDEYEQTRPGYTKSNKLYPIDYDGDGKTDICLINDDGTFIYTFEKSGKGYDLKLIATYPLLVAQNISVNDHFLVGDINGDGKTDFILSASSDDFKSNWKKFLSTGKKGDMAFEKSDLENFSRPDHFSGIDLLDMNGDGQGDLVVHIFPDPQTTHFKTFFLSNGKIYKESSSDFIPEKYVMVTTNNFMKKQVNQQLTLVLDSVITNIVYKDNAIKDRLLTSTVSSSGVVSKFKYRQLNEGDQSLYQMGWGAQFPYFNYQGEQLVVGNVQRYSDNLRIGDVSYYYKNAVVHRQGLGFCGFEQISATDHINLNGSSTALYDVYNFSLPKQEITNIKELKKEYSYTVEIAPNKIRKMRLDSSTVSDQLRGISATSTYKYDAYGNPIEEVVDYGNGIIDQTNRVYTNINTETFYLLGLPTEERITKTRDGNSITSKNSIKYNAQYLPESKTEFYNGNQVSEQTYQYDNSWNLIQQKTKIYGSPNLSTINYNYDSWGRIIRRTDPFGLFEDYQYNPKGELWKTIDHKGHSTIYEYDVWGRKIKVAYADGSEQSTTLSWSDLPRFALYLSTTSATGQPDKQVYLDALGREVRKGQKRFDGKYLYTDNVYYSSGNLEKTSLPFKGASPTEWNRYEYDLFNRLLSVNYASGKSDKISYDKLKTKTIKDGVWSIQTKDAGDAVVSIEDIAGIIKYNLRPDGQPNSIVAPGGITTSFEYDGYGRQIKIVDPSAGTKIFGFDEAGNPNYEKDAHGRETKMMYDKYNRMTSKDVIGEMTSTYRYDEDGLLTEVSSTNGTKKAFVYDDLFRLTSEKENVMDGKWLEKTYQYKGNTLASTKFVSQNGPLLTENYTYTNGHHTETTVDGGISIWELTAENDLGMPTASKTGVLSRTYEYNIFGIPTARIVKNGDRVIQDFGYEFDSKTGNLTTRKDNTRGLQENFGYDPLNRLVTFGDNKMYYDEKGNITYLPYVGMFKYSQAKPYAIEKIAVCDANDMSNLASWQRNQTITYNTMMRPASISENDWTTAFSYNMDGDRVKMHQQHGDTTKLDRYYIASQYELDARTDSTVERLYLDGDPYSAAAVYIKKGNIGTIHYICRDYLGSITHVTNQSGALEQELSYDAWGRLRNPENQAVYEVGHEPTPILGSRGYTGHEHLIYYGLINMNARLYDPIVGRFLSPDPYVQAPDFSQNFNRYSYALNNPLRYTDPNGEFLHIIVGAIIGGTVNLIYKAATGQIHNWSDGFAAFGIGAVAGAIGAATGGAAFVAAGGAAVGGGGFIAGMWGGVFGYIGASQVQSIGNNVYFGDPLMSTSEFVGGVFFAGVTGGIVNGALANVNNKNFWNGNNIAPGRNSFSFNNTPKIQVPSKIEPLEQQFLDVQKTKIPTLNTSKSDVIEYTLNYEAAGPTKYSPDGIKIDLSISRPEIKGYSLDLRLKTDLYHNFPANFDNKIIQNGGWSGLINKNGLKGHWFELPGTINGKSGMFQIGINTDGIIYHKHFRPIR